MPKPGESVVLPGGAERIVFRKTGGEVLEVEAIYSPGGSPPPEHYHPRQEERFECLAGTVNVRVDGQERTLEPGQTLAVPPNARHAFWNGGAEEGRLRWEVRPPLGTEEMFEQLGGASSRLDALRVVARHGDEFRLARPPWALQRPLLALVRAATR